MYKAKLGAKGNICSLLANNWNQEKLLFQLN